jgi:protein-disulfide isomerase
MEEQKKKNINIWQITTIVFAVLFLLTIFNIFSFSSTNKITGNAVAYINENLLEQGTQAKIISTEKSNGLIKATLDVNGQIVESYISSDGKLLFPGAIDLTGELTQNTASQPSQPSTGIADVSAADGVFLGPEDAENVVIEFSDFQCPFCGLAFDDAAGKARFGSTYEAAVPKLEELARQGKIKFVFRNFPLSFHENAMGAALAAECANEQGKFWEYHDILFMNQDALTVADLKKYASDLKLDTSKFNSCIDSEKYQDKIDKDLADGQDYGVSGTPAFFVNGQLLSGSQPWSEFEPLLNL